MTLRAPIVTPGHERARADPDVAPDHDRLAVLFLPAGLGVRRVKRWRSCTPLPICVSIDRDCRTSSTTRLKLKNALAE